MIHVLGIPILNRPDLLYEMLASIDYKPERVVIIDNGGVVEKDRLSGEHLIQPGFNLGVSASWNLIVKTNPLAPWWLISNFDIRFGPGDLGRIIDAMVDHDVVAMDGFSIVGISARAMSEIGFFDENFIPAYYEDNDWLYRARLADVEVHQLETTSFHARSSTILSDEHLRDENHRTFIRNREYYQAKWGGLPFEERFVTPFDAGVDRRIWTLDPARLAELSWR